MWPLLGLASRRNDWVLPFGAGLVLGLLLTPQGRSVTKKVVNISEGAVQAVADVLKGKDDAPDQETS